MLIESIIVVACFMLLIAVIATAVSPRLWTDLRFIGNKLVVMRRLQRYASAKPHQQTLVDVFEDHVHRNGKKTFVIYQDEVHTYEEIDKQANKVAHVAVEQGLKKGDTVAMLINNEPAFISTFLGLAKIGVTCSLLNFNLRSKSLLHCFKICRATTLIIGQDHQLLQAVTDIEHELRADGVSVWVYGTNGNNISSGFLSMNDKMNIASDETPSLQYRSGVTFQDSAAYIYTSGTTGLPKAARLSHYKLLAGGHILSYFQLSSQDVIYLTMPLYHISALFIGLANAITAGSTVVLRNKFSATNFWDDCRQHNVTVIIYIGELFRYLLARPKQPNDTDNKVRLAVGNGLGADIWNEVKERYSIPQIVETYGATEGNFGMMNVDNKLGSTGCWSTLLRILCPIELVKYEYETAQPERDENGRCIKVKTGEVGLLICPVTKMFPLEGYVGNKDLMQKKILNNVFVEGDLYYNTGDLFVQDNEHFFYFKDRLGDTFRWKGENVATTEVSQVFSEFPGIEEACVYGVTVTGHYGKAGMAAICHSDRHVIDYSALYRLITHRLPNYACPRFLRVVTALPHTSTFKQKKTNLLQEGFDPNLIPDPMYFMDSRADTYSPLTTTMYSNIVNGTIRI